MDTDALVKLAKSSVKEMVTGEFETILPEAVRVEAVDEGKSGRHADALLIEDNIDRERLHVEHATRGSPFERAIVDLELSGGEADLLRLYGGGKVDAVISDDRWFLNRLQDLRVPAAPPAMLLVRLARRDRISKTEALLALEKLSPFISEGEHAAARHALGAD